MFKLDINDERQIYFNLNTKAVEGKKFNLPLKQYPVHKVLCMDEMIVFKKKERQPTQKVKSDNASDDILLFVDN